MSFDGLQSKVHLCALKGGKVVHLCDAILRGLGPEPTTPFTIGVPGDIWVTSPDFLKTWTYLGYRVCKECLVCWDWCQESGVKRGVWQSALTFQSLRYMLKKRGNPFWEKTNGNAAIQSGA